MIVDDLIELHQAGICRRATSARAQAESMR
jgi:hypothetical protein